MRLQKLPSANVIKGETIFFPDIKKHSPQRLKAERHTKSNIENYV